MSGLRDKLTVFEKYMKINKSSSMPEKTGSCFLILVLVISNKHQAVNEYDIKTFF